MAIQSIKNKLLIFISNLLKSSNSTDMEIFSVYNKSKYDLEIIKLINSILSSEVDTDGQMLTKLVALIFVKLQYFPEIIDGFDDVGRDILVYKDNSKKTLLYSIQCKSESPQNNTNEINFSKTLSFSGAAENDQCTRLFITSNFFTDYAIKNTHNVTFIDRIGLIQMCLTTYPLETAFVLNKYSFYNDLSGYKVKQLIKEYSTSLTKLNRIPNYKIVEEHSLTCPSCKQGKVQRLFPKNSRRPHFKCRTCNSKFYQDAKSDFLTMYARDTF